MRAIYASAAAFNAIAFVAQFGYGVGLWSNPELNSGVICVGFAFAFMDTLQVALFGKRS